MANSIPKCGTHLLLRLVTSLGFDQVDFGGVRPRSLKSGESVLTREPLRSLLGTRPPGKFLGIGPHLLEGGRPPQLRRYVRTVGTDKVPVGVDFPVELSRSWLSLRLGRVPDGTVISAHCRYSQEFDSLLHEQGIRTVCIVRDPRDMVVSHMHYLKELPNHQVYDAYTALGSDHERLMYSIRGGSLGENTIESLGSRYRNFLDWEREGGAALVRFEDLVGPGGGGSEENQREAVRRVADFLEARLNEQELKKVSDGLFGKGRTFRKGQSGGWRKEFTDDHREAFKEVAGSLLVEMGYENSLDW